MSTNRGVGSTTSITVAHVLLDARVHALEVALGTYSRVRGEEMRVTIVRSVMQCCHHSPHQRVGQQKCMNEAVLTTDKTAVVDHTIVNKRERSFAAISSLNLLQVLLITPTSMIFKERCNVRSGS